MHRKRGEGGGVNLESRDIAGRDSPGRETPH